MEKSGELWPDSSILPDHFDPKKATITFFEFTTAVAFLYFREERVDLAVLETGMGGRLDATNVIDPLLALISPISLEHQQYLGKTLLQVAGEKAGIIKPDAPFLPTPGTPGGGSSSGNMPEGPGPLLCHGRDFRGIKTGPGSWIFGAKPPLEESPSWAGGSYQVLNASLPWLLRKCSWRWAFAEGGPSAKRPGGDEVAGPPGEGRRFSPDPPGRSP
jgi:dihydrofolate synthase/folylpolyglutamate synthase